MKKEHLANYGIPLIIGTFGAILGNALWLLLAK
jgi:hypothetical protein